tara:strand:+ start:1174 stop:1854 length:681 start_codon:yes stop_codon:yes gene_type:complete
MKWIALVLFGCIGIGATQIKNTDELLSVRGFDEQVMNDLIFNLVNNKRVAKGLEVLKYETALSTVAKQFQSKFEFRRFKYPEKIERKIERKLALKTRNLGFKGGLVLPIVGQGAGVDYKKGEDFFYDKKETETEFHLFYGNKPKKKDKDKSRVEIPHHTYLSFAKAFLKKLDSKNKKKLYSKSYKWGGLYFQWYYKSINKKKIPQMKMIFILGGYQTAGMWDNIEK